MKLIDRILAPLARLFAFAPLPAMPPLFELTEAELMADLTYGRDDEQDPDTDEPKLAA